MHKIIALAALAAVTTLAGCASAPPAKIAVAPPPPPPVVLTASAQAQRDAVAKFGPTGLKAGDFIWRPAAVPAGDAKVVISLSRQLAWVYQGDEIIGIATVSSGKKGKESPWGVFPIMEKRKVHRSNRYSNAPMPFMQRLNKWGVALHGGAIPGYPASHGCIRLPLKFAEKLFGVTKVGTPVIVDAPNV